MHGMKWEWKYSSDPWSTKDAMVQNMQYEPLGEEDPTKYPNLTHLVYLATRVHAPSRPSSEWTSDNIKVEWMMLERELKNGKWVQKGEDAAGSM